MIITRASHFDNRRRLHGWSVILSLLVALSLVAPPSHLCALMESSPSHGHADGRSHAAVPAHKHSPGASSPEADHHNDHPHAAATDQATLQPVPQAHGCCSDRNAPPVVVVGSRFAAPNTHSTPATFALVASPSPLDIFALTHYHGRDGPPSKPLHSQLSRAFLIGLAPPVSV